MDNSKTFYEAEADTYDRRRWLTPAGRMVNAGQTEILKNFIYHMSNYKILEIAAGTGRFTEILLDQKNIVTALDISASMLQQLKRRLSGHPNFNQLLTIVGDARSIQLPSSSVDVVLCFNALSHISEHERVFREVQRVLKPDGLFLFNIPNYLSLYFPFGVYVNLRKMSVTRDVFTKWYTHNEIKTDLEKIGFKILDIKGQLHVPTKTPSFILPLVKVIDSKVRNTPISAIAPILFVKAVKIN